MSKPKNVKINTLHLFSVAHKCYQDYENTRSANMYGRYLELRRLFSELDVSKYYLNFVYGKKPIRAKSIKISSIDLIERAAFIYDYNKQISDPTMEGRYDALVDIMLDCGLAESYFEYRERSVAYAKKNEKA